MSTYVDKQPLSLIERKKQQWAKEREELAALGTPWSAPKELQTYDRPLQRNRYVSTFAMSKNNEIFREDNTANNYQNISRRSSLPPLYKNQQQQQYNNNTTDRSDMMMDKGGETSGYGSDNNPNQNCDNNSNTQQSINQYWNHHHQSGYESSSSYKDDRLKWPKDQKHLWVMKGENEPPNWVKRGLQNDEEIVVVSNSSPAESPQYDEIIDDRPYTGCSNSMHKSFIRGQNIPVDSVELAEREKRRQIAMAHQEAVRQQLQEREERRRHEREQRIREEREEELRIEREQEIERQRKEHELRLMKEKQEREQKRKQAIQEAIQQAEKQAQLEKIKLKVLKQHNSEDNEIKINNIIKEKGDNSGAGGGDNEVEKNDGNLHQKQEIVLNNEINNNLDLEKNNRPKSVNEKRHETLNAISNNINNNNNNKVPASVQILQTPRSENLALVVQTPIENLQNLQYAVLVSNLGGTSAIPIAIPVVPTTTDTPPRTENRLLTPTLYRNRNKKLCDCSTQTDSIEINNNNNNNNSNETKCIKDKLTNLDYDNRTMCRKQKVVEERPKWNANRPPTRYLKQSEKDPLYQRRKLRQKTRDSATKENSSDDSQTNSPRSYRKKNFIEKRHHTRALWRKNDNYFTRNIRMYQTEIVPLDSDKDQIYYHHHHHHHNNHHCCRCSCGDGGRIDILKIEHNSSTPLSTTREPTLPNCGRNLGNTECLIDKLTSLHDDLFIKQEHWEKSPRTPNLSSSTTTRNTADNN